MTSLSEHLAAVAVEDGDVPAEVAAWVDGGARPDLADLDEDSPAAKAKRWEITGTGSAAWAVRLYLQAKDEEAAVEADYRRLLRNLEEAKRRALEPATNTAAFMEDKLTRWALEQRSRHPERKTFYTPAGTVGTRVPSKPWKVEISDKEALRRWAVENGCDAFLRPELQTITEIRKAVAVVEKSDVVSVVAEGAEVVPGLSAEPTRPTVIVRPEVGE